MPVAKSVIACVQSSAATASQTGPCQPGYVPTVEQVYVLNDAEAVALQNNMQPFSPELAGGYFGFAFVSTVSLWALAHGIGEVVRFIRKN